MNLNPWVEFCKEINSGNYVRIHRRKKVNGLYVISSRDHLNSVETKLDQKEIFRQIYTIIHIITLMISRTLITFQKRSNMIPDDKRTLLSMKNEFLYISILTTPNKKHYQGQIKVQEGKVYKDPKLDVKGRYMPLYIVICRCLFI